MWKLQDNPNNVEALRTLQSLQSTQNNMQTWAVSRQKPRQFTGYTSTRARAMSQQELPSRYHAWTRKEQFKEAAPVSSHFGMRMLQKMGWNPGEGLGKNKEGALEPLVLDAKVDKKGLRSQEELRVAPRRPAVQVMKDFSGPLGKHPVSALMELCIKKKWPAPTFHVVFDYGPGHKKNFIMKVNVNGVEYKPAVAASTKKIAKANAAAIALLALSKSKS